MQLKDFSTSMQMRKSSWTISKKIGSSVINFVSVHTLVCIFLCFLIKMVYMHSISFILAGMWVKGFRDFPHANQEANNAVESYHYYLKTKFLFDRRKKCSRRMDWLIYVLLINVEPFYRFKEILKREGYLNNYKKEKLLESSLERAKTIPDSDCFPHESISHAYWVRSQTTPDRRYLVTWYRPNFMTCDFPWAVRGNICKHAIKVG